MKTLDLCGTCAAILQDKFKLTQQLPRPANNKIFCAQCRRKRFGGTYQVEKKEDPA